MLSSIKISGIDAVVNKMIAAGKLVSGDEIFKAVLMVATPYKEALKKAYISEGHEVTGSLVNSIDTFRRRKSSDGYFTYYVGPRYGQLTGGNAAHLLEFGTAERFRANVKKGGYTGKGGTYGAKLSTGKIRPFGTIRRLFDVTKDSNNSALNNNVTGVILKAFKDNGFEIK